MNEKTTNVEVSIKDFKMIDPYNPGNTVTGKIFKDVDRYGNLLITHVNDHPVEQYIYTTPKFYYPGHHESPRAQFKIEDFPNKPFSVFEKLDGTNIFMFKYVDGQGNTFTSFKTRLVPFLRTDGFKDWISIFEQAAGKHPELLKEMKKLPGGHAFEMYGYLNEILIKYDVQIDLRYIYTVDAFGGLNYVGRGEPVFQGNGQQEALSAYNKFVAEAERLFKDGKRAEGFMFYFDDGTVYKSKPICVVQEQSASPFIGWDDIYVTAMNAAESIDTIDELLGTTRVLLAETYESQKIERSEARIVAMVEKAMDYLLVQKEAMNVMKEMGFSWSDENKAMIMRAVMQRFPKDQSAKIYGMLSGKKPTKVRT
jgi:hypothetical protein